MRYDTSELYGQKEASRTVTYIYSLVLLLLTALALTECSETPLESHVTREDTRVFRYAGYFLKNGSPDPVQMAVAVMETKRPALMAAMAVKESNGNPRAVGDGGHSRGAWQVQPKHWGTVPMDPTQQALQAEKILDELVAASPRRSLRCGLARYNGGNTPPRVSYQYARDVIKMRRMLL